MAHIEQREKMSIDRLGKHPGEQVPFEVWYACSRCNRSIPSDSAFCPYCGVKFHA